MKSIYCYINIIIIILFSNCINEEKFYLQEQENQYFFALSNSFKEIQLSPYISIVEDKLESETIDSIQKNKFWFQLKNNSFLNFGFTNSYYWIKIKLHNSTEKTLNPILELTFPRQDEVEFYYPEGNQFAKRITGDIYPFSSREINHLNFAFSLNLQPNEYKTYYLKTKSKYNRSIANLTLLSESEFHSKTSFRNLVNGILYGFTLIMLFYHLFLYFIVRDLENLYSSIFIFLFGFMIATLHGTGFQYFYPNHTWFQNRDYTILAPLIILFLSLYTDRYLELKINLPTLHRFIFYWSLFIISISIILPLLIDTYPFQVFYFLLFVGVNFIFFEILLGLYMISKKYRPAYFYTSSLGIFFVCVLYSILSANSFIPTTNIGYWSFQFGFASLLILFSLGHADKINLLKNRLKKINESLEETVEKRTSELQKVLSTIKLDMKIAQKIQANILPLKDLVIDSLQISSRYLPLNEVGGDFFDFVKLNNGIFRVFLADATGHGVQAALMTMSIHSEYNNIKEFHLPAGDILTILNNHYFYKYSYLNTYFTSFILDLDLKNNKIFYSSAGHIDQIFYHKGKIKLLKSTGKLMGVLKGIEYKTVEVDFFPNDKILLFTDGIFEEFNKKGEEFSEDRLIKVFEDNIHIHKQELLNKLINSVFHFMENTKMQDDITLLLFERSI